MTPRAGCWCSVASGVIPAGQITIRYALPHKSQVLLAVYNTLGQQVATLVQGLKEAGSYEVKFDGTALASGVYFYRLQTSNYVETRKLLLLR